MSDPQGQRRPMIGDNMSSRDLRAARRLTSFAYWMSLLGIAIIGVAVLAAVVVFVIVLIALL